MTTSTHQATAFATIVEETARALVGVEHYEHGAFVRTPVLYASGGTVVVHIREDQEAFFVSDLGLGYQEADLMGAGLSYGRHARSIAEHAGVGFDNQAFFVLRAAREQLPGAVATIANCSQEAVALTAYKLAERKAADEAERLYDRLIHIFQQQNVARHAEVVGASNYRWPVATLVRIEQSSRPTIFEPVTKHHTSVVNAAAKFNDIARLERPPNRVAVVRGKREFGTYLGLLAQAANVVDVAVPDETLARLAGAA